VQIGELLEQNAFRLDPFGQAHVSNVPGFVNVTIGAANLHALAVTIAACQVPITFSNGLCPPTAANSALRVTFTYVLSDGQNFSVSTVLLLTTNSPFANTQDQLGNPYQTVVAVSGTRSYLHIPSGATVVATITGLVNASSVYAIPSQRFYPYSLLVSSPGVYPSVSEMPFWDYNCISFAISASAPALGRATSGNTTQYSVINAHNYDEETATVLAERQETDLPL
jgi:hypothetical protein